MKGPRGLAGQQAGERTRPKMQYIFAARRIRYSFCFCFFFFLRSFRSNVIPFGGALRGFSISTGLVHERKRSNDSAQIESPPLPQSNRKRQWHLSNAIILISFETTRENSMQIIIPAQSSLCVAAHSHTHVARCIIYIIYLFCCSQFFVAPVPLRNLSNYVNRSSVTRRCTAGASHRIYLFNRAFI